MEREANYAAVGAFVLVVAPRQDAIDEGQFFVALLGQSNIPVQALIVNRLHPHFDVQPAATPLVFTDGSLDRMACGTGTAPRCGSTLPAPPAIRGSTRACC